MVVRRRKKIHKYRGERHARRGYNDRNRNAGIRGGRGRAGMGKLKDHKQSIYTPEKGFYNPTHREIKAIICSRGGYGSIRILEDINYQIIRDNPKIFVGYSDITALLMAITKKTKIISFHGPMVKDLAELDPWYLNWLWNMLTGKCEDIKAEDAEVLVPGDTEGILLGGNLNTIVSLVGTGYLSICKNTILFLEDINEPYYRIDRMLTQLRLSGFFKNISGLILGKFKGCGKKDIIDKIVLDIISDIRFPIISNFPIGHSSKNVLVPLGVKVRLNTKKKTLIFLERPFV
jgi:muramoyltetrapeptide carboxypeptidase